MITNWVCGQFFSAASKRIYATINSQLMSANFQIHYRYLHSHTVLLKQQQFNETMCFQATIKWDHVFPNNNSMRPCVSKQQLDKIMCFKVIVCIFSIMFGVHCQLIAHKTSWWNRFTSFLHGKHVYHQLNTWSYLIVVWKHMVSLNCCLETHGLI
jgi:hypothetical protein